VSCSPTVAAPAYEELVGKQGHGPVVSPHKTVVIGKERWY
jgi:hypothetical protein